MSDDDSGSDVRDFVEDAAAETPKKPKLKPGEWSQAIVDDAKAKGLGNIRSMDSVVRLPLSQAKLKQLATISEANRKYNKVIAEEICARLLSGETMASICRDEHIPHYTTIWDWTQADADFRQKMEQAKRDGSHYIADDCIRIADDQSIDPMHKRIMVDTRLRLIKSWHRRAYGDNVQLSGEEGNPVRFFIDGLSDREIK